MNDRTQTSALEKLKARIQGLRAKTLENGCTEAEALLAAAKVAELLDRHDLSLTDVEIRDAQCTRRVFESHLKKRTPLEECVGAIAHFCDCRVWREKDPAGATRYVFFGLGADTEAALWLTKIVDGAVRSELGRYKASADYRRFRHQERHLANASFALGMVTSIAAKLMAMKSARHGRNNAEGRYLVVVKKSTVEAELARLGVALRPVAQTSRMVSPLAYDAGDTAGAVLDINPATFLGRGDA